MKRIDALLADYGASHRTPGNLACHAAGITLILFGLLSILAALPVGGGWTASELLVAAAFVVYAALDVPLALAVLAYQAILDVAARGIGDWRVGVAALVIGWTFQAVGHGVYEKNRPAFFHNLAHLAVGPAYLAAEALGRRRPAAQ